MIEFSPEKVIKFLRNFLWVILVFLLVFMPYSTFVLQLIRHTFAEAGYPFTPLMIKLMVGWKEILLLLMMGILLLLALIQRTLPFRLTKLDFYLLGMILFGVIVGGLLAGQLNRVVFGFRYDFSPFLYYFAARSLIVSRAQLLSLLKLLALAALPLFLIALLQTFYLPMNFLERFGYSWGMTATGNPLPPYHLVANQYVRAMATFPGPNSFGMYAVFLFLLNWFLGRLWFSPRIQILYALLAFTALLITFSRGHLISLAAAFIGWACLLWLSRHKQKFAAVKRTRFLAGLTIFVLIIAFAGTIALGLVGKGQLKSHFLEYILHQESSEIHRNVRLQAWEIIKTHPFGTGLGTSGLATTNTGEKVFNPESWYLQITQELGWAGLLLALGLLYYLCYTVVVLDQDLRDEFDQRILFFLAAAMFAILMSANFLPSWFEVTSLSWWIVLGFLLTDYLESFPRSELLVKIHQRD